MNDDANLERRYGRLLGFYPSAFRREHEREVLSVLMADAREGQRWPRPAEALDLMRSAASMRLRIRLLRFWAFEFRHRRFTIPVRIASGIWLFALTVLLYRAERNGWWAVLLVPAALLHFYVAYRSLRQRAQK